MRYIHNLTRDINIYDCKFFKKNFVSVTFSKVECEQIISY